MGEKIKHFFAILLLIIIIIMIVFVVRSCGVGFGNGSGSGTGITENTQDTDSISSETDSISSSTQSQSDDTTNIVSSSDVGEDTINIVGELTIVVHGQNISIGNDTYSDSGSLEQFISDHYSDGMSVVLQDDYADYQTYQDVIETLDSLKISYSEYIAE